MKRAVTENPLHHDFKSLPEEAQFSYLSVLTIEQRNMFFCQALVQDATLLKVYLKFLSEVEQLFPVNRLNSIHQSNCIILPSGLLVPCENQMYHDTSINLYFVHLIKKKNLEYNTLNQDIFKKRKIFLDFGGAIGFQVVKSQKPYTYGIWINNAITSEEKSKIECLVEYVGVLNQHWNSQFELIEIHLPKHIYVFNLKKIQKRPFSLMLADKVTNF